MTKPISEEEATALIISYRTDLDRYRDRARTFATLIATAAGALTAGLVFSNVGQSFPAIAKLTGYVGIILLTISVCSFLSGMAYRLPDKSVPKPEKGLPPPTVQEKIDKATTEAKTAAAQISNRISFGSWIAAGGLAALFLMLPLGHLVPDSLVHVSVQPLDTQTRDIHSCQTNNALIDGYISNADLSGSSALIPITVSENQCGDVNDQQVEILYFDRGRVVVSVLAER